MKRPSVLFIRGGPKPTTPNHSFESFPETWNVYYPQNSRVKATQVYAGFSDMQKKEIAAWILEAETEKGCWNAINHTEWAAYFGISFRVARTLVDKTVPFPKNAERKARMDFGARPKPQTVLQVQTGLDGLANAAEHVRTDEDMDEAGPASGNRCCQQR
jgi:hypothetical protein